MQVTTVFVADQRKVLKLINIEFLARSLLTSCGMLPFAAENLASRFTEPLLHPAAILLDATVSGSPVLETTIAPVVQLAWRLLGFLLAL